MQQHLQRLDGVAKAEVSLRDGQVVITPKPEASLDPYRILKATYDSGVTVTEMQVAASGTVAAAADQLELRVTAQQSFPLVPNAQTEKLKAAAGTSSRVAVKGMLYRKPTGGGKQKLPTSGLKLEITEPPDVR